MRSTAGHVVSALVSAGLVDPARAKEAEAVTSRALVADVATRPARATTRGKLVEIAAYVGAALVLASIGLFLAQEWTDFSQSLQVATLGAISLLLLLAAVTASLVGGGYGQLRLGQDEVRRRLTSALLVGASLAAAFTVGLQVSIGVDDPASSAPVLAGSATMFTLSALGYAYVSSALGLLAIAAAGWNAVLNGWMVVDERGEQSLAPALAMLAFAGVWLVLTETGRITEPMVGRAAGMVIALFGAQLAMSDGDRAGVAYALTFAVACAGFGMYLRSAAWPYLVAGVLGVTIVVPEAVIDWTGGALGPAGAVLVAGLTLLGASLAGFRVHREVGDAEEAIRASASADPDRLLAPVGAEAGEGGDSEHHEDHRE